MKTSIRTLRNCGIVTVLAAAVFTVQQHRVAHWQAEVQRLQVELEAPAEARGKPEGAPEAEPGPPELAHLRATLATQQAELLRLRGLASRAVRAESEAAQLQGELQRQTNPPPDSARGMAAPMGELMQGALEQMAQRELKRLHERLNLSAEQAGAIQEVLTRRARGVAEATKGVLSGRVDQERLAALRQGKGDTESQILDVLTPEQQTAYRAFKEEESLRQVHAAATSELVQMRHTLGLTDAQQERVFATLYDEALRQREAEAGAEASHPANPAEAMRRMLERKLQALEGALTPAQWADYREQQNLQLTFLERMVRQTESAAGQP